MEKSNKKEEINLLDILRFLQQKRKNILLSIIASVFVFAGAFFILVKPLYESEAILRFKTTYLNRIYFGGGTYGVNAALKYYSH